MSAYILSLDQGTTSSRALLFNKQAKIIGQVQKEFQQFFPNESWVEHDASDIWLSQHSVAKDLIASSNISIEEIAGIGITNQRETTIIWDRNTLKPISRAIVWQDRRTAAFCEEYKNSEIFQTIKDKTGLILDAYFSASKIKWILDNVKDARSRAEKGELCFGTVDSWLVSKLTKGGLHITDVSNASRTMLYNIREMCWDKELCDFFDIPMRLLPEVRSSSEVYGMTHPDIFGKEIPISGIAGDQQAALFGQQCTEKGMVKNTYGTGCFLVMNTGDEIVESRNQMLSTIAWQIGSQVSYALEGSVFVAGAIIQWLRDGLKIIKSAEETEALAKAVQDSNGVYFVPALTGLAAPHWDPFARGTILGLSRGTQKEHIVRAALEGIAFQVEEVLHAMALDISFRPHIMKVDGGAVQNDFLMQFQSDISNIRLVRPKILESTALGAAFLAGLAVGFWDSLDELKKLNPADNKFDSKMSKEIRNRLIKTWTKSISKAKNWIEE
jgi:glycerol kinase